jgi:hypothetical protein
MSEQPYQPEVGQMCYGQPWQRFDAPPMLEAALQWIKCSLDTVLWNRLQRQTRSPFDNSGATFDTEGLSIHAYSWDDDKEQPWNLKCGDVEVSWYKHSWRGVSVNRELSNDEIAEFLDRALSIVRKCDIDFSHDASGFEQPFKYNGDDAGESRMRQLHREEREAKLQ